MNTLVLGSLNEMSMLPFHQLPLAWQCLRTEELVLNLDTADVRECDRDLYKKLVSYPREVSEVDPGGGVGVGGVQAAGWML
jgi:hypothetical protein